MAGRFLAGFGNVLVAILKAIAWLILNALQLVLNVAKVFLLLLGLVM
ncbi:unknown [Clostridium sp. CAG:127]|nr:unknown [Clostridium sp. CAG:127]